EGLFFDEVSRETAPGGGVGSAIPAVCERRPSRCKVGASNLPLAFSPCEAWNLRIAAVVSSSHFPLGEPCNEPLFASAACISMIRSLVGAFWPGCFLDFFEAGDLLEFFRETFAELLPPGLLAVFPVAVDVVAVGFVAERPAALFAEVEVELEFFG